jgi:prophage regulatory protein
MSENLLRLRAVIEKTGKSKSSIYEDMAVDPPKFPSPVSIGKRAVAWIATEVDAWVSANIAKRVPGVPPNKHTPENLALQKKRAAKAAEKKTANSGIATT